MDDATAAQLQLSEQLVTRLLHILIAFGAGIVLGYARGVEVGERDRIDRDAE